MTRWDRHPVILYLTTVPVAFDYTEQKGRNISGVIWKGHHIKWSQSDMRHYHEMCQDVLRRTTKTNSTAGLQTRIWTRTSQPLVPDIRITDYGLLWADVRLPTVTFSAELHTPTHIWSSSPDAADNPKLIAVRKHTETQSEPAIYIIAYVFSSSLTCQRTKQGRTSFW